MSSKAKEKIEADPVAVEKIIHTLKSRGCFDQFRKEFLADVDTKVICVISFRDFSVLQTEIKHNWQTETC